MIPFDDALDAVLLAAEPLGIESVSVEDALNRYLASDFRAAYDSPLFDNSSVDGFAVRAQDLASTPVTLRVAGAVYAGDAVGAVVDAGTTVRTMTGARMPTGADAMVMQEDVEHVGDVATFGTAAKPGQAVRKKGEEFRQGDLLIKKGTKLNPQMLALIVGQGCATIEVGIRPNAAIIVTGSELAKAGSELFPGQVYESNSTALVARSQTLGVERPTVQSVVDDYEALMSAFEQACQEADIVVFSGGASVGEKDLVRRVCLSSGVDEAFWRINMKPGKPVFFGRRGRTLVFALPGNPVSAQVTFSLLVGPAVRKMSGSLEPKPRKEGAVLGAALKRNPGRLEFVRATTQNEKGRLVVTPLERQGSHMSSGLALADRLIVVGPDQECIEAGSLVETISLEGGS